MKLLLDTHLILWSAMDDPQLSPSARAYIEEPGNELFFSAASFWEIMIKLGLGRDDFRVDPQELRQGLLDNEYIELPVTSAHTLSIATIPTLHKDPFDRILLAQAQSEKITLLTADNLVAQYPGAIIKV